MSFPVLTEEEFDMPYTDICIDLETLSTSPRTVILSIGAVAFNRFNKENDGCAEFETFIDLKSQQDLGREIEQSTLSWWLTQSRGARSAITNGWKEAVSLKEALANFFTFVDSNCDRNEVCVWGNGANFDNPAMEDAFNQVGSPYPWKFWNDRCLRTLLGEVKLLTGRDLKKEIAFTGVKHSALSDAYHQANLLITATDILYNQIGAKT